MNKRKEIRERLNKGEKVYLVDEIDEVPYDFTNYPHLRVKSKGGKLLNENIQVHQVSFGLLKY